ncbi:hypothetical protein JHW43_005454 [Diplocarpon mali]|nr:hypothetical protein JHW43_005454 [Diplocarpon mali]
MRHETRGIAAAWFDVLVCGGVEGWRGRGEEGRRGGGEDEGIPDDEEDDGVWNWSYEGIRETRSGRGGFCQITYSSGDDNNKKNSDGDSAAVPRKPVQQFAPRLDMNHPSPICKHPQADRSQAKLIRTLPTCVAYPHRPTSPCTCPGSQAEQSTTEQIQTQTQTQTQAQGRVASLANIVALVSPDTLAGLACASADRIESARTDRVKRAETETRVSTEHSISTNLMPSWRHLTYPGTHCQNKLLASGFRRQEIPTSSSVCMPYLLPGDHILSVPARPIPSLRELQVSSFISSDPSAHALGSRTVTRIHPIPSRQSYPIPSHLPAQVSQQHETLSPRLSSLAREHTHPRESSKPNTTGKACFRRPGRLLRLRSGRVPRIHSHASQSADDIHGMCM